MNSVAVRHSVSNDMPLGSIYMTWPTLLDLPSPRTLQVVSVSVHNLSDTLYLFARFNSAHSPRPGLEMSKYCRLDVVAAGRFYMLDQHHRCYSAGLGLHIYFLRSHSLFLLVLIGFKISPLLGFDHICMHIHPT